MPKPIAEQCADRGIAVPVGKTADEIRAMGLDVPAGAAGYAVLRLEAADEAVELGAQPARTGYVWDRSVTALFGRMVTPSPDATPPDTRFYPLAPVDLPMETGDVLSTETALAASREYQARCWAEPLQTYGPGSYYRAHENPLDHEHDLGCLAFFVTGMSVEPDTHGVFSLGVRIRTAGPRGAELASKLPDLARAFFAYTRDPDAPPGESVRIHRIDFRELG